jgi:indole-3-glycerol phosphate synthase
MILDKIVDSTRARVSISRKELPLRDIMSLIYEENGIHSFHNREAFAFEKALRKQSAARKSKSFDHNSDGSISFLCEVKKASPSKGMIAEEFPYLKIAKEYEQAGADAISVLTEPEYFKGDNRYLSEISSAVRIPVLRKDFTIDEYQIYEAKVIGADAVLLICSLLDTKVLKNYIKLCDELGLSALVEAHTKEEIVSAMDAGARIIGVNNRNLQTFEVDLNNSIRLRSFVPQEIIFVAESGIKTAEDIQKLREAGVNAVLIGETLMRSPNKKEQLEYLRG